MRLIKMSLFILIPALSLCNLYDIFASLMVVSRYLPAIIEESHRAIEASPRRIFGGMKESWAGLPGGVPDPAPGLFILLRRI
jgi:hypothetical protein